VQRADPGAHAAEGRLSIRMAKQYDRAYFDRWYRDPKQRVKHGGEFNRKVRLALSLRPDVVIVRNPAFRSTTTQQSYWLGGRYLKDPCVYMDGDIIFDPASFHAFLDRAGEVCPLIGIAASKTEQAVFAETLQDANGDFKVSAFSRSNKTPWEWANIACLPPGMLQENGGDVFSRLAGFTPLNAQSVECFEFDTDADLVQAEKFGQKIRSQS
jgi:hypothetical protein